MDIGPNGVETISGALAKNKVLTSLWLDGLFIVGSDYHCRQDGSRTDNKIGSSGAAALKNALMANSVLTELHLDSLLIFGSFA